MSAISRKFVNATGMPAIEGSADIFGAKAGITSAAALDKFDSLSLDQFQLTRCL